MSHEIAYTNKYKLPPIKLFSKLEIISDNKNIQYENYWCVFDNKYYVAILSDNKLIAKQYPGKNMIIKFEYFKLLLMYILL